MAMKRESPREAVFPRLAGAAGLAFAGFSVGSWVAIVSFMVLGQSLKQAAGRAIGLESLGLVAAWALGGALGGVLAGAGICAAVALSKRAR